MNNLKKNSLLFFKNYWPILFLGCIVFGFFWKVFLLKQVAVPADILAGPNYPVKNPITSDAVSFSYPMKFAVISFLKSGVLPLWNPYILFGTPLLANFQSGVFSITNIFYFLTDFNSAWNLQIIFQHILAAIFMYILLRHWKISKLGAILGSIGFAFGGFNLIWSEWNAHALTASFIPLLIYFADRFINERKYKFGFSLSLILALQLFSGYPQIVLYTVPALGIFYLIHFKRLDRNFIFTGIVFLIFIFAGLFISAPQTMPGIELLKNSQRAYEAIPHEWAFLTPRQIITFIASDFYGNHATQNYWGDKNYTSNIGYVGVVVFTLAILAMKYFKKREILFLILIVIFSLMFSFSTPIANFLWEKDILGLKAGASYRILVLFSFAMNALAAFGLDYLKKIDKKRFLFLLPTFLSLIFFWIYGFSLHNNVALRNLILPTGIFIFVSFIFTKAQFKFLLIFLIIVELFYFGWKFTPFVPRNIVYPPKQITDYIKSFGNNYRTVDGDTIPVDTNMVYGIDFASGYDAEYPLNTAKYLVVLNSNDINATPQDRYGLVTNTKSRLLDLGNVRFIVNDNKVIENTSFLPRSFYTKNYIIEKDENKTLPLLLNDDFDLRNNVILEQDPKLRNDEQLYFISDTYYPGWKAYVDGVETKIYKADFDFEAIVVPNGSHDIKILYEPDSFYNGVKIALATLIILAIIGISSSLWKRKHF